ncbi:MAG TPA: hypothetical protein VHY58_08880 [Streptosporangiaceae bacterium]|nr:hypothetical protein [Streptosporangiaceae bacterium]
MPNGFHHITLRVNDLVRARAELDRMAEALRVAGVPVEVDHDALGNAIVHFRDPDNFQWELFEEH